MTLARTAAAAAVLTLGISIAPLAGAVAAPPTDDVPCAKEQGQLDKAQAKLESLTAKLAAKKEAIAEAKAEVKASTTAQEKRSARAAVATAKEKKATVKKAKKFQVQRVEHAQERLDKCLAKNPAPAPAPAA
ncbi:hypothetical protein KVF89_10490 [Nocardioides carbamazepini]|uniref:hypothetical protein n=1 Tax=Nocardioides carbamazepini TaxID=2854259 RepID=UPI00214A5BF9|nr:hypothetical protein [Nocardioides carbamazepini]MCR1782962.1 hypothetical protein [Nocardioides carbamazepini]